MLAVQSFVLHARQCLAIILFIASEAPSRAAYKHRFSQVQFTSTQNQMALRNLSQDLARSHYHRAEFQAKLNLELNASESLL